MNMPSQAGVAHEASLEHRFNDDIALEQADLDFLFKQFPDIVHALDNPELRAEFAKHEAVANRSKKRVQFAGMIAIALAATALLAAAAKPTLHLVHGMPSWVGTLLVGLELLALAAAAIAMGGFGMGKDKIKWLEARMMTEILRAWHFQFLIYRGKEVEASCATDPAKEAFLRSRTTALEAFVHEWTGKADSHYLDLLENADVQYRPLHDSASGYTREGPIERMVFRAYRLLRFQHQLTYSTHKLKNTTDKQFWQILKWPTRVLQDRTTLLARVCVLISLVFSVVVIFSHFSGYDEVAAFASVAIVSLLVLNVVSRTIQDGLAAPKELERYRDYQQKTRYLLQRFDHTAASEERLEFMRDMERAAIEELRSFLRANEEARFVL